MNIALGFRSLSARALSAASTIALGTAALAGAAQAQEKDVVRLGLAIPMTVTDGGVFAMGLEQGFYDEENIEPEFIVLQGAGSVVPQVAQKQITIGQPLPETVLGAYKEGTSPLPVTYFYNAIPRNTLQIAVLADSGIETLEDLEGRDIGVGALTWGTIPQTRALLRSVGLEPGEDTEIVPVGVLGSGFHALREGRVDALNYNHTWIDLLEQQGTDVRRLEFPDVYRNMINNAFLAHNDTIEENPDLLVRFGRAYAKSVTVCAINPEACVEAFWRMNPEAKPQGDEAEALAGQTEIMKRRMDYIAFDDDGELRKPAEFDLDVIRNYVEELHEQGELDATDIPLEELFTNQLVDDINDFDREAVIEQAEGL